MSEAAAMTLELTTWLAGLGPTGPLELDELAACFLRHCRGHAGALREARSVGLDRSLAGWRATLADGFRTVLRTTVARLDELATETSLEVLWQRLQRGLPERPDIAAALVARVVADALDEAIGHRYVDCFRRRGRWRLAPGDPFPVAEPALRELFGRHLTTHPDVRDLPIDRTSRLALTPEADGVELVVDFSLSLPVPGVGATLAVCVPHGSPSEALRFEADPARGEFFGVRPRDPAAAVAVVRTLVDQALEAGASLIVFPELAVADDALAELERAIDGTSALVVAGSRHTLVAGAPRNVATVLAAGARLESYKFNPFVTGDLIEGITTAPAQVIVRGTLDAAGRYAWSMAVLVCKDFLSLGAHHALTAARPSVIVVPALTERTAVFEADAIGLTGATQATCIIANQVDAGDAAREDAAVVIITRPVPWALCEVVRRGEMEPPACILLTLRPAPP